jgi:hypothetical protein
MFVVLLQVFIQSTHEKPASILWFAAIHTLSHTFLIREVQHGENMAFFYTDGTSSQVSDGPYSHDAFAKVF